MTCCRHSMPMTHGYFLHRPLGPEKMLPDSDSESDSMSDNRFLERYLVSSKARSKARGRRKGRRGGKKQQPTDCQFLRVISRPRPPKPQEEELPQPQDDNFYLEQFPYLSTFIYGAVAYCITFWILTCFNYQLLEWRVCTAEETCDVPWNLDDPSRSWEPVY